MKEDDSDITINLGTIGYWHLSVNCLDFMDDYSGPCMEEFIWEATITQDGYRCWYICSDSLIEVVEKAIKWINQRKYLSDKDIL